MPNNETAFCRVCGFEPSVPPWGMTGSDPSWEICPCCGVEYGYEDASAEGARRYRRRWLELGAPWSDSTVPDDGLTLDERSARVPDAFR